MSIFVSYADQDDELGRRLVMHLKRSGLNCADRHGVSELGPEDVQGAVASAIRFADIVIVIWSKQARRTQAIVEEADVAFERRCLLLLLLDDVTKPRRYSGVPTCLLQALEESDMDCFGALLTQIDADLMQRRGYVSSPIGLNSNVSLSERIAVRVESRLLGRLKLRSSGKAPHRTGRTLSLGDWAVCAETNELSSDNAVVKITPGSMELLMYMMARDSETVSMSDILEVVWNDRVVGDNAVHQAISELRHALGDDSRAPRYIRTIHRKGYRLVANIKTD